MPIMLNNPRQNVFDVLRPRLLADLVLVKRTCHANRDQVRQIKDDVDSYLQHYANAFLQLPMAGGSVPGHALLSAYKLLEKRLLSAVEDRVSRDAASASAAKWKIGTPTNARRAS